MPLLISFWHRLVTSLRAETARGESLACACPTRA